MDPRLKRYHGIETDDAHVHENWTPETGVRWTEVVQSTHLYEGRRAQLRVQGNPSRS